MKHQSISTSRIRILKILQWPKDEQNIYSDLTRTVFSLLTVICKLLQLSFASLNTHLSTIQRVFGVLLKLWSSIKLILFSLWEAVFRKSWSKTRIYDNQFDALDILQREIAHWRYIFSFNRYLCVRHSASKSGGK